MNTDTDMNGLPKTLAKTMTSFGKRLYDATTQNSDTVRQIEEVAKDTLEGRNALANAAKRQIGFKEEQSFARGLYSAGIAGIAPENPFIAKMLEGLTDILFPKKKPEPKEEKAPEKTSEKTKSKDKSKAKVERKNKTSAESHSKLADKQEDDEDDKVSKEAAEASNATKDNTAALLDAMTRPKSGEDSNDKLDTHTSLLRGILATLVADKAIDFFKKSGALGKDIADELNKNKECAPVCGRDDDGGIDIDIDKKRKMPDIRLPDSKKKVPFGMKFLRSAGVLGLLGSSAEAGWETGSDIYENLPDDIRDGVIEVVGGTIDKLLKDPLLALKDSAAAVEALVLGTQSTAKYDKAGTAIKEAKKLTPFGPIPIDELSETTAKIGKETNESLSELVAINGIMATLLAQNAGASYKDYITTASGRSSMMPVDLSGKNGYTVESMHHKKPANSLLDFVSKADAGKAGYNAIYGGKIDNLTQMTVREVLAAQDENIKKKGHSAVGAYQITKANMMKHVESGRIGLDDVFSKENQDKLGMWHLTGKIKGSDKFEKAKSEYAAGRIDRAEYEKIRDDFIDSVSKEWAAIPTTATGRSYYDKDGLNKSRVSLEQTRKAFDTLPLYEPAGKVDTPLAEAVKREKTVNKQPIVEREATKPMAKPMVDQLVRTQQQSTDISEYIQNPTATQNSTTIPDTYSDMSGIPLSTRNTSTPYTRLVDKLHWSDRNGY